MKILRPRCGFFKIAPENRGPPQNFLCQALLNVDACRSCQKNAGIAGIVGEFLGERLHLQVLVGKIRISVAARFFCAYLIIPARKNFFRRNPRDSGSIPFVPLPSWMFQPDLRRSRVAPRYERVAPHPNSPRGGVPRTFGSTLRR